MPLAPGYRHLVFTGSAVTFPARLTVRSDTASRLFDTLCIIHRSVPSSFVCKSEFLSVMIHTPVDASFQIVHIIRVLTHSLARGIGDLCDIHAVAQRGFHDNIQCRYLRIIRDIGANSKKPPLCGSGNVRTVRVPVQNQENH